MHRCTRLVLALGTLGVAAIACFPPRVTTGHPARDGGRAFAFATTIDKIDYRANEQGGAGWTDARVRLDVHLAQVIAATAFVHLCAPRTKPPG